jgi:hypothetical protein
MSSSHKEPQRCLGDQELREFVRYARKHGLWRESFHSEVERADRNISPDDIAYGLDREDWTLEKSELNQIRGQWKYKIRTVDIEEEQLTLLIGVDLELRRFEVISKW